MPFGTITEEMLEALRPHVRTSKVIMDLGAGDTHHARQVASLCPSTTIECLDKTFHPALKDHPQITLTQSTFSNAQPKATDLTLLFWPVNYPLKGFLGHLRAAKKVAYLGCNLDGTSCGTSNLFMYLTSRKLLTYIPHQRNSLIVVGEHLPEYCFRCPTFEEIAGLDQSRVYSWQDHELYPIPCRP